MVTIIKVGKIPQQEISDIPEKYEIQCDYCQTIFSYEKNDIKFVMPFRILAYSYVECPLCTHQVIHQRFLR